MNQEEVRICRICFDEETKEKPVINPCKCKGSSKYIHEDCLSTWLQSQNPSSDKKCEVCKYIYQVKLTSIKKCDPRESISQNPHFLCYFFILLFVTVLLIVLIYVVISKGYADPKSSLLYFLGLMSIFGLAFICSLTIMIKLLRGILFIEVNHTLKIFPVKQDGADLNTTVIFHSLPRVDSAENPINENFQAEDLRMHN